MNRSLLTLLVLAGCGKSDPVVNDRPGLEVVSTIPVDGATGVSAQTAIRVAFSGELDAATVDGEGIVLMPPVDGSFDWDKASKTASFLPAAPLPEGAYTVTVTDSLSGARGEAVLPSSFSFEVGQGGTTTTPGGAVTWTDGVDTTTLLVTDADTLERGYTMSSTHPQRDGWPQEVQFEELPGQPVLRSGSTMFDALFALAVHESRLLSVSAINDGAFSYGNDVPCDCFQTGEKWHYVWTRDTAYAVDLGLAVLDPERAANSLAFKLSGEKASVGGGGLQIVQDTGTGGSWPVSTDRVVWAFGADRVLAVLDGPDRNAFRDLTLEAVVNTAEVDRTHVFDPADGLYRGETSFLDWREQTYPQWTASDVRHIAESKSLSTNVGHWKLLDLAARLSGEVGDTSGQARYRGWADQLAADIDAGFWIDGQGWSRVVPNQLDSGPLPQYDWLATSLMALTVAPAGRAQTALSTYPQGTWGPPVIWPQQPLVPIYHNRSIWPFVTAYGVRAAAAHQNEALVAAGVDSLTKGSLRNLSNMENFELLSGANWYDDGPYSGPVVNSHYQLWSVAGYASMVFDLFGLHPEASGLMLDPYIPEEVAGTWLPGAEPTLHSLSWKGRSFDLVLEKPAAAAGALVLDQALVDGAPVAVPLQPADLPDGAELRLVLRHDLSATGTLTELVDDGDFTKIFAPRDPAITALTEGAGGLELTLDANGESGVVFDVWRDGVEVASGVSGPTWVDLNSADRDSRSYCYAVSSRFGSGNTSQRSQPQCWWGPGGERVQTYGRFALVADDATWSGGGPLGWENWGNADAARVVGLTAAWTGPHLVQVVHSNGSGPISTGLTASTKHLSVVDSAGVEVGSGVVVMPQSADWGAVRDSTGVVVDLVAGEPYTLELTDTQNMSWLDHFSIYTAGLGGGTEPYNAANLDGVKLLPLQGVDQTPTTGALVVFDGTDDLGKLGPAQTLIPGAQLQPWEAFGMTWDEDWLYLAFVSQAFEGDYRPMVVYVEAGSGLGPATPGTGFEYDALVPELPFTPTHAISLRNLSDDGNLAGPWDGVRVPDGPSWSVTRRFERGVDSHLAADEHTLAVRVPLAVLGNPSQLRLVAHVVEAQVGSEWVDTVPSGHTPWAVGGGAYHELDLTGPTGVINWTTVP